MNEQDLRKELEAMSTWTGGETRLWERALESEGGRAIQRGVIGRLGWVGRVGWARAAAVLVGALGLGVLLVAVVGGGSGGTASVAESVDAVDMDMSRRRTESAGAAERRAEMFQADLASSRASDEAQTVPDSPAVDRRVAYSATVALRSADVRAASERIRGLLDASGGEFVEQATVSGEGGAAEASLVLRVRSERLDGVLAAVRAMGDVVSESVAAEDLTARIVDIDARIRNERRVETELIELLSERDRADLNDVVTVHRELGSVRGRIERMESQLAGMGRQVSLSTVRVSVAGREGTARTGSGWSRFTHGLGAAWSDGLRTLERSVQGLVAFAVGRVLWWGSGVVLVVVGWRMWRKGRR